MKRTPLKRGKPMQRRTPLKRGGPLKRTGGLKRAGIKRGKTLRSTRRRETAAERRARQHFFSVVTKDLDGSDTLCFFADVTEALEPRRPGHVCDGDLDAHHLIAKSWIQRYFGDLPEDELLAIKYAPIIGAPICRAAHDALPANLNEGDRIYFEELEDDLIDFCERLDRRYASSDRRSLLNRLRDECPRRPM